MIVEGIEYSILFVMLYFEVFILVSFIERYSASIKQINQKQLLGDALPSVSIIVPCFNEEKTLAKTVHSLLALDYPKHKLNIIIVDDGSTDNTETVAGRFAAHPRVTFLQKENGGKHTALNLALAHERAASDLVGCLDADSFVSPDALKEIIPYFDNPATMAVTPAIRVHDSRTLIEMVQKAEYNLSILVRHVFGFLNTQFVTPGPFSIFRKRALEEAGPFTYAYGTEDMEMCLRLQSRHYEIQNAHRAYVFTSVPKTLKRLLRQRVRWTYGFLRNIVDYRFMLFRPHYRCLGNLVLPTAGLSIFGALYFSSVMIWKGTAQAVDIAVRIQTTGITLPNELFSSPLFFLNSSTLLLLVLSIIILTGGLILLGKYLASEEQLFTRDIVYFLALYGFIAPVWLAASVVNAIFGREGNWQAEHESR